MAFSIKQVKAKLQEYGVPSESLDAAAEYFCAAHKTDLDAIKEQRDTYKADAETLAAVQKELNDLKAAQDDGWKDKYDELKAQYDSETAELKGQLADRDYSDAISRAISGKALKFSSKSARRAFETALKEKKLELKDGELSGLDDFIKAQKEADPDAFAPEKPTPRIVGPTGNGGAPAQVPSRAAQLAARYNENLYGKAKESN